MDGQKYAVAEYENKKKHAKNLAAKKPTSLQYLPQKGGAAAKRPPPFWFEYWPDVAFWVVRFLHDFVDFHILPMQVLCDLTYSGHATRGPHP